MSGLDHDRQEFREGLVPPDKHHLRAGNHDVAHLEVADLQDAFEHAQCIGIDEAALGRLAQGFNIRFGSTASGDEVVWLDHEDVTRAIRTEQAGNDASKVAALAPVRAALLERQRGFAVPPGLVADGRDMGTVVFPRARYKETP